MSETKPPSAAADQMAKDLKNTLARRRRRPWATVLLLLAIGALLLAGATWWLGPKPRLDPLQIAALDEICAPEEKLRVRAQLYAPVPEESPRRMRGHTVIFLEPPPLLQPAGATLKRLAESDEHGQAWTDWPAPKPPFGEFRAEYVDLAEKAKALDHGRVFVVAKETALLLVDVDETLKAADADGEAVNALTTAASAGWQIVYLALASDQPLDYRKTRDWTIAQTKLPRGPVLGRGQFGGAQTNEAARRELLRALGGRFTGGMAVVVKSAESAAVSKEAGLQTLQIDSWKDVPARLKKY